VAHGLSRIAKRPPRRSSVELHLAGLGTVRAEEGAQRLRAAGAGYAGEAQDLAGEQIERDVANETRR